MRTHFVPTVREMYSHPDCIRHDFVGVGCGELWFSPYLKLTEFAYETTCIRCRRTIALREHELNICGWETD